MMYSRALLKISGESLKGSMGGGIDSETLGYLASQISEAHELGVQLAVVIGGGNIWRGQTAEAWGMQRATADYAGMVATVINALALQNALEDRGSTPAPRARSRCRQWPSRTSAAGP